MDIINDPIINYIENSENDNKYLKDIVYYNIGEDQSKFKVTFNYDFLLMGEEYQTSHNIYNNNLCKIINILNTLVLNNNQANFQIDTVLSKTITKEQGENLDLKIDYGNNSNKRNLYFIKIEEATNG